MARRIPTPEQKDAMVASYLAGMPQTEAAGQFGFCHRTCGRILQQRGIPRRSQCETSRRYTVDHAFFDVIDSEEKAYWLGFLTADGNIGKNTLKLQIQRKDIQHLYKYKSSLCSMHPIYDVEGKRGESTWHCGRVEIHSTSLTTALRKLGVKENKSFTVRPCEGIPGGLLRHYWRGVLDGDGCITSYLRKNGSRAWSVSLIGNREMVSGFSNYLYEFIGKHATVFPTKSVFTVFYGGGALPQKIVSVLYKDAMIFLDRKRQRAQELMETSFHHTNIKYLTLQGNGYGYRR